ncbi:MAG: DUF1836 domain-containing protein [Eubacterium sp.]|nr:DUF1836 domain-containing protein [Eubacterium sp.]
MDKHFRVPRWEEIPDVDLYLDQVISLIDGSIGQYVNEDGKKALTKTMVNNYVKHKIIEAPDKKKYSKLSVASLFVITILKSSFSINEIGELIKLALVANDTEISYNQFCEVLEDAVRTVFAGESLSMRGELNEPQYILRNVCRTFACSLYVKETYFKKEKFEIEK